MTIMKPCHDCGMFSYGQFPCRWCEVMAETSKQPEPPDREPVSLQDLTRSVQELRATLRFWLALVLLLTAWGVLSILIIAS